MNLKNIKPYTKQTTMPSGSKVDKPESKTGMSTYEIWLSRLNSTLRWRMNKYDKDWNRAYRMFNGSHWRDVQEEDPSSDQVRDRITVNVTMSSVLNIVPFLMTSSPEFHCKPRKPGTTVSATLQQAILNYEWEQRDMNSQVKKAVYDGAKIGHGIVKTGYILELDSSISKAEGEIFYEDYIKESSPYIKRICPFHFLIDPTASENNLETARWCAEIFYKTQRDIVANDKYDASVRNKIKSGIYTPTYKNTTLMQTESNLNNLTKETDDPQLPESQLCMLWEVWDKKYRKYYVFADNVPEPLLEKDWPYEYLDNFPYVKFDFIPIEDDLYGVGIPYSIEDQQFELNRIRTSAFEHRRRFNRKYQVLQGLNESELNKIAEGEDGAIVRVPQMGAIAPIEDASIPQDTQLVEAMIRADVQELTGLDALLRGGQLPSRTTAGEVSTRTSLFRLKLDDRVEGVDKFVLKAGNQILQHIKSNFTSERIIEIVGEQGAYWETLTPQMIKDDVDVSMETISAPKVDPLLDRQQRLQIWQISTQLLPLIQAGLVKIDLNELFGWVLESFGMKDVGRFYQSALTPQAPLKEVPVQPNLNNLSSQPQQNGTQPNIEQPPSFDQLFQQIGGAAITNQGGNQL